MKFIAKLDRGLLSIVVIFLLLLLTIVGLAVYSQNLRQNGAILNYQDCANSPGSRIQETYPSVCVTENGLRFVNPNEQLPCYRDQSVNPDVCR